MNEYSEPYLVGNQQPRPVVNDEEGGHRTVCGSGSVCVCVILAGSEIS